VVAPLSLLPPAAGLVVLSLGTTIAMLLVVKALSNQDRVEAAKRQIHAALLEIRLFNHDLRAMLRAALEVFCRNGAYLRALALPTLVAVVPLVVLLLQLDAFYGFSGLPPGVPGVITARLRDGFTPRDGNGERLRADIEVPASVRVNADAIWFPAAQEIVWKVTPLAAGRYDVRIRVGDETFSKRLHASDDVALRAASRASRGWLMDIFEPADAMLPDSAAVTAIAVRYESRRIDVLGWRLHWLVVFAVLSLSFAFVLKRPLGVVF
jgi:hypothetical protein